VNRYGESRDVEFKNFFKVNPESEKKQIERLNQVKQKRDNQKVRDRLEKVKRSAMNGENMVFSIMEAVKEYATIGEICTQLRQVYGEAKMGGFF